MRKFFWQAVLICVVFSLILGQSSGPGAAQRDRTIAPVLLAYQCELDQGNNNLTVRAILRDAQGRAIPPEQYTVTMTGPDQTTLGNLTAEPATPRPPLRMIVVLDITTTMPIALIEEAMLDILVPDLNPQDEMALITFAEEISPRTTFYTDKGTLANEHIRDLITLEGDNRLYTAQLEAVQNFPADYAGRQVVLVLTDSSRRETDVTSVPMIIEAARQQQVQIFTVALHTRDTPAVSDLTRIATETGGHYWEYSLILEPDRPLGEAVGAYFAEMVHILDSEIVLQADLPDIPLDEASVLPLNITVERLDGPPLTTAIDCLYEPLHHELRFINTPTDILVRDGAVLQVEVETDLPLDKVRVRFLDFTDELDVVPVLAGGSATTTLDAAQLAPGEHQISAQLINLTLRELATAPENIALHAQRDLELRFIPSQFQSEATTAHFEVLQPADLAGSAAVQFTLAPTSAPDLALNYGTPLPFDEAGRATLLLTDIQIAIGELFPGIDPAERFLLGATIPGLENTPYPLAVADPLLIAQTPPTDPPPSPAPVRDPLFPPSTVDTLIPPMVVAILILLNLLLVREVRWARNRRMYNNPDDTPMSPQLMTVTVHRDGLKQTHTLSKRTITVGRGPTNDINLGGEANISRQHGVFMWRGGKWTFSFRKRRAAARINGKRQRGPVLVHLKPVAEIEIGRTLLVFHSNTQQDVADYIKTDF